MTTPRKEIFDPAESGFYHCISRCVRRAFLCGTDSYSGKCFEHRKEWIRSKLASLLEIFAFECLAYAAMSTHLHSLLRNLPLVAHCWSDDEVARRWRMLFPLRRLPNGNPLVPSVTEIAAITSDRELVDCYRQRLCDISWFQRCLNEEIARRANAEDECTGRFWEGRFSCKRVEGPGAILACSVYIDLNPIRSGSAETPETSRFTSIQQRIQAIKNVRLHHALPRLAAHRETVDVDISEDDYLMLVDEAARQPAQGKRSMHRSIAPILERVGIRPEAWGREGLALKRFRRVIANSSALDTLAQRAGKNWFQGHRAAVALFA